MLFAVFVNYYTLMGLVVGALLGMCAAAVFTWIASDMPRPLRAALVPVAALVGLAGGGASGYLIGLVALIVHANGLVAPTAYERSPLRAAACGGDMARVASLVKGSPGRDTRIHLGQVTLDCAKDVLVSARCNGQDGPLGSWSCSRVVERPFKHDLFRTLMPVLHALYVDGQRFEDSRSNPYQKDYCGVLDWLVGTIDLERLKAMQSMGLPLRCASDSAPRLEHLVNRVWRSSGHPQASREALLALGQLVGARGGVISQSLSEHGATFLDRVVARGDPLAIVIALRAGVDPRRWPPDGGRSAVLEWTLRKFLDCRRCSPYAGHDLDDEQIAAVDELMPAPTARDLDAVDSGRLRGPMVHLLDRFKDWPDGGAAYLRYLLARGADPGVTFTGLGGSVLGSFLAFHRAADMKPELMDVLDSMSTAQVLRLAQPTDAASGKPGIPLLVSARESRNLPLIAWLCRRGVEGCTSKERNASR